MKIAVYEVRDDEVNDLDYYEKKLNVELVRVNDLLTLDTIHYVEGVDGVSVLGHSKIDKDIIDALVSRGITYLTTRTVGVNHIDVAYAKSKGLHIANSAYSPHGVADYTVMFMLLVLRHYKQSLWLAQVYDFSLKGMQGREMRSMTVGVIGTGRIGSTVIKNLSGFGCRILCCDTYENEEVKNYATYCDLETIYKECDIITLHTPLTEETHHMINRETIAKMKDGIILINCARGELMDIDALIDELENEKIGALGLDTVETEEGIIHQYRRHDILKNRRIAYLRQFPNVVMTQHIAFYTKEAVNSMVYYGLSGIIEMHKEEKYQYEI